MLDPGETFTFTLNYFLTQADVDDPDGHVLNEATATGLDPANQLVSIMASYNVALIV